MSNPEADKREVFIICVNDAIRQEAFENIDVAIEFVIKTVLPKLEDNLRSRTTRKFTSIGTRLDPFWSNDMCSVRIRTLVLQ